MHSQTDTKKDSVCVPFYTAYRINIDLIDYDRLIVNEVESSLADCLNIGKEKDSIISDQASSINYMQTRLNLKDEKYKLLQLKLNTTTKQKGSGFIWVVSGLSLGILLTLLLTK